MPGDNVSVVVGRWLCAAAALLVAVLAPQAPRAAHAANAANSASDVALWSEVGVRRKQSRLWSVSLDQGLRFDDSMARFSKSLTELGATFRAAHWLDFGAGYRFTFLQKANGELAVDHSLQADARARVRFGTMSGSYRLRLVDKRRGLDAAGAPRYVMRSRIALDWRATRTVVPYASGEVFHKLRGNKQRAEFDKTRLTLGTSFAMNKRDLDVYLRLELPIADAGDPTLYILGVGHAFAL